MKQKFMKKPIVVEAYQTDKEVIIQTLEGSMKASIGDWIITGIRGEQYPCKPDVFERTYQLHQQEKNYSIKGITMDKCFNATLVVIVVCCIMAVFR